MVATHTRLDLVAERGEPLDTPPADFLGDLEAVHLHPEVAQQRHVAPVTEAEVEDAPAGIERLSGLRRG